MSKLKEGEAFLSLVIPEKLKKQLQAQASAKCRSLSNYIRMVLAKEVKANG